MNRWAIFSLLFVVGCGRPPSMPESLRDDPSTAVESDTGSAPTVLGPEAEEREDSSERESVESVGPTSPTGPIGSTEPDDPEPGFVVINEIYYDAVGGDTDGRL